MIYHVIMLKILVIKNLIVKIYESRISKKTHCKVTSFSAQL